MKFFLSVLILIMAFKLPLQADDIKDFEIEGMSVGDSALDFFTKGELDNSLDINNYKTNKFKYYFLSYSNSKDYEYLQITVKPKDKNFIIYGLQGHIFYENNIKNCYKKMDLVKKELDEVFGRKGSEDKGTHPIDISGKSKFRRISYYLTNGSAEIICYDMSKQLEEKGKIDRFAVTIDTTELKRFLTNEAYK